uniref:Secologanin synthase n=1 Tax=Aegilops tauschii TaxID=37682 RepID=M8BIC0_AEGTA
MGLVWMVAAAVAVVLASWAFNALVYLLWRPHAITRQLRAQGVGGPGYRFFAGNLAEIKRLRADTAGAALDVGNHDFVPMVQPYFRKWIPIHGRTFLYWFGARPTLCVADVNTVKQVLSDRSGLYPKNISNPHIARLLGNGLVLTDGDDWKRHRKVVHPAFNMDKLKMMTVTMSDCAGSMMSEWKAKMAKGDSVEIELSTQFEELAADVISHTAFGSSYEQGKKVFLAQRELQFLAFSTIFNVQIPAFRYLPTEKNLKIWKLDKEACAAEGGHNPILSMDEIIDECKTFFFAGHDTSSHLLTWTMFLLSTHPEWQEKLREEVLRECGSEVPTGDMLNKLHLLNMFLLETQRLYAPVSLIQSGPRSCIGQNFAMIEAKAVIPVILQRFSFSLSPKYVHAPMDVITLRPKFGLPMILKSLEM